MAASQKKITIQREGWEAVQPSFAIQKLAAVRRENASSIDLLHLGCFVCCTLNFFQGRKIIVVTQPFIIIDAEAEFDHAMDAACKLRWLIQIEARGQQRS